MKISWFTKGLCLVLLLAGQANGAPVYTFSLFSGDLHYDFFDDVFGNHISSFRLGNSGHDGEFVTVIDKLTPILLQSTANGTHWQGATAVEYDGAVSPKSGIGVYDFNDVIFTSVTSADQGQIDPHLELVDFAYASVNFTPGPAPVDLFDFQGGPSSRPLFLPGGPLVSGITGTIGGLGSQNYYEFLWNGGTFNATGRITGADALASYSFSAGVDGGCNSVRSATLDSGDNFTSTIAIANLAPGQYCIGVTTTALNHPAFALEFNSPVIGFQTPEPSGLLLCGAGLLAVILGRLRR